jgi:hypothetical protein
MHIIVPLTYAEIEGVHPTEDDLLSKLALLNRKQTVLFLHEFSQKNGEAWPPPRGARLALC